MAEKRGSARTQSGSKGSRTSEIEDDDEGAREKLNDFRSQAGQLQASGDQQRYIAFLEGRNRELQNDNFDLRRQRKELTREVQEAGEVPDDKVLVDKKAWEANEKAGKVLTELGITDPDVLKTELPAGRDAVLASAVGDAHGALGLTDQGSAALRRLVVDHKLKLSTTVEKVDGKDTRRTFVEKDGKKVPIKDFLETHHAEYAPFVFQNAKSPTGSVVGTTDATGGPTKASSTQERRMPAIGPLGSHRATTTGRSGVSSTTPGRNGGNAVPPADAAAMRDAVVGGVARKYQRAAPPQQGEPASA